MNYKNETEQRIRILFNNLKEQYPKNFSTDYLHYSKMRYLNQLTPLRKNQKKAIDEIFVKACKYISTIQFEIAYHNLRNQGIV